LGISSSIAASAAKAAAKRKEATFIGICRFNNFLRIAFQTFGPINKVGSAFISALGHWISLVTHGPRETFFSVNASQSMFNA
jgi:hypothetical protein